MYCWMKLKEYNKSIDKTVTQNYKKKNSAKDWYSKINIEASNINTKLTTDNHINKVKKKQAFIMLTAMFSSRSGACYSWASHCTNGVAEALFGAWDEWVSTDLNKPWD